MDPNRNPFSPGAGYQPPALACRDQMIEQATLALSRVKNGRPAKGLILTGLRGVGKTVLLNRIENEAEGLHFQPIVIESVDHKRLASMLVPALRSLLVRLDRMEGISEAVKLCMRTMKSFVGALKVSYADIDFSIDVEPEPGRADSGDLERDFADLMTALGQAAKSRGIGVALIIDEMQYLAEEDLSALIMGMHRMAQKQLPVIMIGAGLPPLLGKLGNSKSYSERMFEYITVGALDRKGVEKATREPVEAADAFIDRQAIDHIMKVTEGYPYFVQEWGYHAWNAAKGANIDQTAAQHADYAARKSLDGGFFSVRFDRLTPKEREYLRAMAYFPIEPVKSGKIADVLGQSPNSVARLRGGLIKKGMIYSPAYGDTAFTVPFFGSFMRRRMKDWSPKG